MLYLRWRKRWVVWRLGLFTCVVGFPGVHRERPSGRGRGPSTEEYLGGAKNLAFLRGAQS